MSDRTLIAYFKSEEEAHRAAERISSQCGDVDTRVMRFSIFPGEQQDDVVNPVTGDFNGLGEITLGGAFASRSARILAAASPSASGLAGQPDDLTTRNVQLTAVCADADVETCVTIMRECGGLT